MLVTQFRYLLLTVFPVKLSVCNPLLPITNGFLNVCQQFKFETDSTKLPATDNSNCSLCCTKNVQLHYITLA